MKRTFSIRTWLIAGIVAMVLVAYAGVFVLAAINEFTAPDMANEEFREEQFAPLIAEVEGAQARWEDPAWQAEIRPRLAAQQLGVTLTRPGGTVAFEFIPFVPNLTVLDKVSSARLYDGGEPVGFALWRVVVGVPAYRPNLWERFGIPVGIVVVVSGTVWFFVSLASRAVLDPLKAAAQAAERINGGDLNVSLPVTRIRELNDFTAAFAHMRDGLQESLAAQAAMEQERGLFIAAMAHDLRTPLTSVRGYLEGIRDGVARTPDMLERYVRVALEKTGALERLVDGLFNYSRTEYLNQAPRKERLAVGDLVESVLSGVRPQASAKGVALTAEAAPDPVLLEGDPTMLHRVLDNLLDNALRHTPPGGCVSVGWNDGGELWVQDTGPGISTEDLPRIFDPLYRGDKARSTRTGGAGLGLAIARRLVEAHGGTIRAETRDGARFIIRLPL